MTAIRIALCVLFAFAVLAHGAVEPWSQSILQLSAAILFVSWGALCFRQRRFQLRFTPLLLPLLGLVLWTMTQWIFGLSLYPYLTRVEFLNWGALLLLTFLFLQAFQTLKQLRGFVWFLLIFSFLVALFGIIQYHTFNGKLYWVRELTGGGIPFGPYVNRNHFAGLMELLIPPGLLLLLLRAVRREWMPLIGLLTVVSIGALFLSASRGGIVSFLCQLGLIGLLMWARPAGRKWLATATVSLLIVAGFLMWLDIGSVLQRFEQTTGQELSRGRRTSMILDTWRIFTDHLVTGTGAGTLVSVYPKYESDYDGKVVDHAHNDYVELLADTGIIGGLLAAAFLGLLGVLSLRRLELDSPAFLLAVQMGALVSCFGLLVHSLVDFNLHIPSNALLFILLALVAVGAYDFSDNRVSQTEPPFVVFSA